MTEAGKQGIDIAAAMEILAERQQAPTNQPPADRGSGSGCPCCQRGPSDSPVQGGGQVIDIFASADGHGSTQEGESVNTPKPPESKDDLNKQQAKLEQEVSLMSLSDKLRVVLQAQEDRVATYRRFDESLQEVLKTGNMTFYPAVCAQVTATFAVLSNTINVVRNLQSDDMKEAKPLLDQLQKQERDKLNFTAALHLEKIRAASASADGDGVEANSSTTAPSSTRNLFNVGIASLQGKINKCVEGINEVLDELKCMLQEEA